MFGSVKELFERVSSTGDAATVLLLGSCAYFFDAGFNLVHFLDPAQFSIVAATAALGIKKAIDASGTRQKPLKVTREAVLECLHQFEHLAVDTGDFEGENSIRRFTALYESGLASDEDARRVLLESASSSSHRKEPPAIETSPSV